MALALVMPCLGFSPIIVLAFLSEVSCTQASCVRYTQEADAGLFYYFSQDGDFALRGYRLEVRLFIFI